MEKKQNNLLIRILVAAVGLSFSGIGVGLSLFANLGVDPASVMETGLAKSFNITFGTTAAIVNVVILLIVFFIDRSYINIASLLAIFLIGYVADGTTWALGALFAGGASLVWRIVFLLLGNVIISLGIVTYTSPHLGVGAIDLVSQIISDKAKLPYRWVRVASDLAYLVIGWVLGGAVGVGTVVSALMIGPVVQFIRPYVYKVTDRIPGCHQ